MGNWNTWEDNSQWDYSQNSTKTSFSAVTISSKFSSVPTCTSLSSLISQLANRNRDNRIKHFILRWIYGTYRRHNLLMWLIINSERGCCDRTATIYAHANENPCGNLIGRNYYSVSFLLDFWELLVSMSQIRTCCFYVDYRIIETESTQLGEEENMVVTKKFWWRWTTFTLG